MEAAFSIRTCLLQLLALLPELSTMDDPSYCVGGLCLDSNKVRIVGSASPFCTPSNIGLLVAYTWTVLLPYNGCGPCCVRGGPASHTNTLDTTISGRGFGGICCSAHLTLFPA